MRYRQAPYSPDNEIAAMLDALRREVRGGELSLVLNGDVFDFDAPRVLGARSAFHDLPRDAAHDVPAIEAILRDHPVFLAALGRVVADGHTVVFVSGNHDVQLTLTEVRDVVRARVVEAALAAHEQRAAGGEPAIAADRAALEARVLFRAWFHKTPDGIIIEHGNQYDPYCSYRYPMAPYGRVPGQIQPTMGSLACRLLISRMGYFNPHVDGSFMLSAFGYLAHWARYYLFSRRSLAAAWAAGAVRTVVELVRRREPARRVRRRDNLVAAARETGAPVKAVARHARLFARPAEDRLGLVARELWLDRVGLGFIAAAAALVWALVAPGPLALAAVLAPAGLVAYELLIPKQPLGATWRGVSRAAREVARAHGARAVVFGHTHNPEGAWERGVFFGNTGSWSAAFEDIECKRPLHAERPLVWLKTDGDVLSGGLFGWKAGRFEERAQATSAAPSLRPRATAEIRG
ncbi:MAG: hypothetical protein IT372_27255 [Polyangiaceae bacterium]|nr:hypothetical protein [Polyangiaceae bacterium]